MSYMPTKTQIKQTIKEEYVKCAFDPAYFMREYCFIQHPIRGKIKFDLYDYQERVMADFKDHDYNIILKASNWAYLLYLLDIHYG